MKNKKEIYVLLGQEVSADEFVAFKKTLSISKAFACEELSDGTMQNHIATDSKGKKYTYSTGISGNRIIHEIIK